MVDADFLLSNFHEIRRRSILLWRGLPEEHYFWRPDPQAMTAMEHIRHVLAADYGWNMIIHNADMSNYCSPWEGRPFTDLNDELAFAEPYRLEFLESVRQFTPTQLATTEVIHPGNGTKKLLGEYLLRIGYHEAVHAGQFIGYLRAMGVDRPFIWD